MWLTFAKAPLDQALHRVETAVSSGVQTVVSAGEGAARAVVSFGQGVMDGGSRLISKWRNGLFGNGGNLHSQFAKSAYFRDPVLYGASTLVPSNSIYGSSGVFHFEITNDFHGSGNLTIGNADANVVGLNEPA